MFNWDISRCRLVGFGVDFLHCYRLHIFLWLSIYISSILSPNHFDGRLYKVCHWLYDFIPWHKLDVQIYIDYLHFSPFSLYVISEWYRDIPSLQSDNHIEPRFLRWSPQNWPHTRTTDPGLPDTIAARVRYVSFVIYYQAIWEVLPRIVHMVFALLHSVVSYKII